MTNASVSEVADFAFKVIDLAQHHPAHVQVAGIGLAFLLLAEHHKANPQDVWTVLGNVRLSRTAQDNEHYRALQLYVKNELEGR